jgi:RNA polymerase sigma-70 factor (ECF subfamily)
VLAKPSVATAGPEAAMCEVDALAGTLDDYHLFHTTRSDLLRECSN